METKKNNRTRWIHLRLRPDEYNAVMGYFKRSTCRKLSEYVRLQLMQKPIIAKYRNESLDHLMTEVLALRNELNAIGNNFNQTVKKLHILERHNEFKDWLLLYELDKKTIASKLEEIKKSIQKIGESWLR